MYWEKINADRMVRFNSKRQKKRGTEKVGIVKYIIVRLLLLIFCFLFLKFLSMILALCETFHLMLTDF